MKIIGLTGGIGSGKSTVLKMFETLGAVSYVADIEAKNLLNSDQSLIEKVIKLFGKQAYENNELNRKYIASIVFNNSEKLKDLNNLVHPAVRTHFKHFIKKCEAEIVIYEAAILFESGSYQLCDYIVTVTASLEDRIKRTMLRDNSTEAEVLERIKHQVQDDFKIKNSNFIIKNNNLNSTKIQVLTVYNLILNLN